MCIFKLLFLEAPYGERSEAYDIDCGFKNYLMLAHKTRIDIIPRAGERATPVYSYNSHRSYNTADAAAGRST